MGAGDLALASVDQNDGRNPAFTVLGDDLRIGSTGGECQHQLTVTEMPNHDHPINGGDFVDARRAQVRQVSPPAGRARYRALSNARARKSRVAANERASACSW
jgi:microcystin-dependent protein